MNNDVQMKNLKQLKRHSSVWRIWRAGKSITVWKSPMKLPRRELDRLMDKNNTLPKVSAFVADASIHIFTIYMNHLYVLRVTSSLEAVCCTHARVLAILCSKKLSQSEVFYFITGVCLFVSKNSELSTNRFWKKLVSSESLHKKQHIRHCHGCCFSSSLFSCCFKVGKWNDNSWALVWNTFSKLWQSLKQFIGYQQESILAIDRNQSLPCGLWTSCLCHYRLWWLSIKRFIFYSTWTISIWVAGNPQYSGS